MVARTTPKLRIHAVIQTIGATRNGKIATSEIGFICDQRDKSANVGALLIPVDGTFKNRQRIIPVLIQKNSDQYESSDLLQHWKNGTELFS
jgi:hypothetical protein